MHELTVYKMTRKFQSNIFFMNQNTNLIISHSLTLWDPDNILTNFERHFENTVAYIFV